MASLAAVLAVGWSQHSLSMQGELLSLLGDHSCWGHIPIRGAGAAGAPQAPQQKGV